MQKGSITHQTMGIHWVGAAIFFVNITGDHIFNKVDYLKLVLCSLVVFLLFARHLFKSEDLESKSAVGLVACFALLPSIAALPGWLLDPHPYTQGAIYEGYSRVMLAIWFGLCAYMLKTRAATVIFPFWLLAVLAFVCLVAVIESLGFDPHLRLGLSPYELFVLNSEPIYVGSITRVASTFGNPNYFSAFVVMAVPVLLATLFTLNEEGGKRYFIASIALVIALALYTLTLAGTRGAIGGLLAGLLLFAILVSYARPQYRRLVVFVVVLIVLVLAILIFQHGNLLGRLSKITEVHAWSPRFAAWSVAWESIKEAPLFGRGLGASYPLFFEYVSADYRLFHSERSFNHVHNQLLEVLQEGGVFGLLMCFVFWGAIFYLALRLICTQKNSLLQIYAAGIAAGLLAYHLHSLVSVAERMVVVNMLAYTLAGWLVAMAWQANIFKPLRLYRCFAASPVLAPFGRAASLLLCAGPLVVCLMIGAWLYQFNQAQNLLVRVKAGMVPSQQFIEQAGLSRDVYVLEEAIKLSLGSGDFSKAQALSLILQKTIPEYRDVNYLFARSYFDNGEQQVAHAGVDYALEQDTFHMPSLHLKAALSLLEGDVYEFAHTFSLIAQARACQKRVVSCEGLVVHQEVVTSGKPEVKFELLNSQLSILLAEGWFAQLQGSSMAAKDAAELKGFSVSLARGLGNQKFFLPAQPSGEPVSFSKQDWAELKMFIRLDKAWRHERSKKYPRQGAVGLSYTEQKQAFNQWRELKHERTATLKKERAQVLARLKPKVDVSRFIRRRAWLNKLASDLLTILDIKQNRSKGAQFAQ